MTSNHANSSVSVPFISDLKILCLNVCGLLTKSQYPEFLELIDEYDILCFVETKLDDYDCINLPGFTMNMKNRFKYMKTKSGGITLAFKDHLNEHISIIELESKYVLWFEINDRLLHNEKDALFGIVYIPPESSKYCVGDPFSELENEFLSLKSNYDNICLLGDFNSRTSSEADFIAINDDRDLFYDIFEKKY